MRKDEIGVSAFLITGDGSDLMRKDEIDVWAFLITGDGSDFGVILVEFWEMKDSIGYY